MQHLQQHKQHGQSAVEIGLLLALMAGIVIATMSITGTSTEDVYCQVSSAFGGGSCGADTPLMQEDFNDMSDWKVVSGSWKNSGGVLHGNSGEGRIFAPPINASDYTVDVGMGRLTAGNGYGIFFRADNITKVNGYTFQYDPGLGGFAFRKWVNGNEIDKPIAFVKAPAGYNWHNTDRQVQVQVKGATFTAVIDGKPVLSVTDATYSQGGIGLRTWYGTQADFDNITVRPTR
ncbi:family 16 glycoside hydrolase [Candidatus Oscillochloris fontis]|uniref:family 16 glycoside hydrolase n=1 Tax=Candidatus Oscillochloris fontis TaxID=2496868 RepID=UPI001375653E|nr:family 16 glycoside hydrolase [Candidatus Oscillochloris fontis]